MNLTGNLTERAETITAGGPAVTITVEQLLGDASTPDLTALFCKIMAHARDRKMTDKLRAIASHESYSPEVKR